MQTVNTYKTIEAPSNGLYKDKGSKFLSFAWPVKDESDIKQHLEGLRKEYFDARHICYAWALGADRSQSRSNDDGEPSGTAGKPIMGQILSYNLTDILIAVVRYFGGTLLGTGGLIQAYRQASANALENAHIIEKSVEALCNISFDYPVMNQVMRILKEYNAELLNLQPDNTCYAQVVIASIYLKTACERLSKIASVKTEFLYYR